MSEGELETILFKDGKTFIFKGVISIRCPDSENNLSIFDKIEQNSFDVISGFIASGIMILPCGESTAEAINRIAIREGIGVCIIEKGSNLVFLIYRAIDPKFLLKNIL